MSNDLCLPEIVSCNTNNYLIIYTRLRHGTKMGKREREVESEEELIAEGKTRRDLSHDTQSRIKEDIDVNNCDFCLVSLRLKSEFVENTQRRIY